MLLKLMVLQNNILNFYYKLTFILLLKAAEASKPNI